MTKPNTPPRPWEPEELDTVRAGLRRGLSAATISTMLTGRSRCAVLGVIARNGWAGGSVSVSSQTGFSRPVPLRRAMRAYQLHAALGKITLAGPAWSHPGAV